MNYNHVIRSLTRNSHVFRELLQGLPEEEYRWKPSPEKWCLLEIVCHLFDEEREDFRARTKQVLEMPELVLPSINPVGWVQERAYLQQNFEDKLHDFLLEREKSVAWLQSLDNPKWYNAYEHPKFGNMTAKMFLTNWLAHDHLHIRQITQLKFNYLKFISGESLNYAGAW